MNIRQNQSIAHPFTDTLINQIYDVVIVGAGPVGLATAVGLRKRGIDLRGLQGGLNRLQGKEFRFCGKRRKGLALSTRPL